MNTLLLQPTDVLFFRDGRPMGGSLSGHGAAWPLPTITNAALHAALHRAQVNGSIKDKDGKLIAVHGHDHNTRNSDPIEDARKFGSLKTAGPFPVLGNQWLFPRPLDAGEANSLESTFLPLAQNLSPSSLPSPLKFPTANTKPANKDTPAPWWTRAAWESYLGHQPADQPAFHKDIDFADTEFTSGIGIDPTTSTQDGDRFYSAHYLRLRENAQLGILAEAHDKINDDPAHTRDLISDLFSSENHIIAGGQQRTCTVQCNQSKPLPLPLGQSSDFQHKTLEGKDTWLVKWILLTPAIFPAIKEDASKNITAHAGGWLPNWIAEKDQKFEQEEVAAGSVLLLDGPGKRKAERKKLTPGSRIPATLIAAITGKPIPVTGWSLGHAADRDFGAKSTHLAVPAGSVYYFECDDEPAAKNLAAALNWHGTSAGTEIKNRRSTLMGEKGFGLGVCSTWTYHNGNQPA